MIAKIPVVSSSFGLKEIIYASLRSFDKPAPSEFHKALSRFTQSKFLYLTNSGISSFYVLLKALKQDSRNEIILPAYTAGSLVVAVIKAGLKPVLCDISLEDFNLAIEQLPGAVSRNTLAVVLVHMFGIPVKGTDTARRKLPAEVMLIEDCAQAMGSRLKGINVGMFGDTSFYSFNRGKNLPIFGGGCIATDSEYLAESIKSVYDREAGPYSRKDNLTAILSGLGLCIATRPLIYGLGFPFISRFKDTKPPRDFTVRRNVPFKEELGVMLLKKADELFEERNRKGTFLINALKSVEGIIVPKLELGAQPVFGRVPILFKDLAKKEKTRKILWYHGYETSSMYLKPLHRMFKIGYERKAFPNACYLSEHLLTIPVHDLLKEKDLANIVELIADTAR